MLRKIRVVWTVTIAIILFNNVGLVYASDMGIKPQDDFILEDLEEIEGLENMDQAEDIEDVEDVEERKDLEELEDAKDLEELEDAKDLEELEDAKDLEELEDAKDLGDLESLKDGEALEEGEGIKAFSSESDEVENSIYIGSESDLYEIIGGGTYDGYSLMKLSKDIESKFQQFDTVNIYIKNDLKIKSPIILRIPRDKTLNIEGVGGIRTIEPSQDFYNLYNIYGVDDNKRRKPEVAAMFELKTDENSLVEINNIKLIDNREDKCQKHVQNSPYKGPIILKAVLLDRINMPETGKPETQNNPVGSMKIKNSSFEKFEVPVYMTEGNIVHYDFNEISGYGGAIESRGEVILEENVTFSNNKSQNGGALWIGANGHVEIGNNIRFKENATWAHLSGMGAAIYGGSVTIKGQNVYFENNVAWGKGAAMYISHIGEFKILEGAKNIYFTGNISEGRRGDGDINWNSQTGGTIFIDTIKGKTEINGENIYFKDNIARKPDGDKVGGVYSRGGAINIQEVNAETTLEINGENIYFINNYSTDGGALNLGKFQKDKGIDSNLQIANGEKIYFIGNKSGTDAAAIRAPMSSQFAKDYVDYKKAYYQKKLFEKMIIINNFEGDQENDFAVAVLAKKVPNMQGKLMVNLLEGSKIILENGEEITGDGNFKIQLFTPNKLVSLLKRNLAGEFVELDSKIKKIENYSYHEIDGVEGKLSSTESLVEELNKLSTIDLRTSDYDQVIAHFKDENNSIFNFDLLGDVLAQKEGVMDIFGPPETPNNSFEIEILYVKKGLPSLNLSDTSNDINVRYFKTIEYDKGTNSIAKPLLRGYSYIYSEVFVNNVAHGKIIDSQQFLLGDIVLKESPILKNLKKDDNLRLVHYYN